MSDVAEVVLERAAADESLMGFLKKRSTSKRVRSHGNYLPALDKALELLEGDDTAQNQLFLVFLSDGAPSDHTMMDCKHGVRVWKHDSNRGIPRPSGKPKLKECPCGSSKDCRAGLIKSVQASSHSDLSQNLQRASQPSQPSS